jgi:hypothetical protein
MEDLTDLDAVPGIVSLDPRVLECEECRASADADTIGLPITGRRNPAMVHLLSGFKFHHLDWPDGSNPRLCRRCRLARGCTCHACEVERRGYPQDAS